MTARKIVAPEIIIEAYRRNRGNLRATARELGVDKDTARNSLRLYGAYDKPLVGGTTKPLKHNVLPLPEKGKVARYILSSAQNNTGVFEAFLKNLEAYAAWFEEPARIMVARFSYNKSAWNNKKAQKPDKQDDVNVVDDCWFDPAIDPYVCDDPEVHGTCRWQLAPDLWFCSEMQIEPTAVRPLSDLKTYTGTDSSIFPHTKIALEPVPTLLTQDKPYTKHIFTTGTVTGRNYIQRKAGLKAEFHHQFGALLVEVDHEGTWFARQLNADKKGAFYDIPGGKVVKVADGAVSDEGHRLEAINWGDVHVTDLPAAREDMYWAKDGVIDLLKPKFQFFHDLFSFRSRSHHEMKSFGKMFEKHIHGQESVEDEVNKTAGFLCKAHREWCQSVVVNSNHDRHLERWLDEENYQKDLPNVVFFLRAQLDRVLSIQRGESWIALEWAMRSAGVPAAIRFLAIDESFVICEKSGHPIECSLHGDIGPNGSRGSTVNLANGGAKISKGHDHSLCIRDGVYSAGTCAEDQGYNRGGLTTWSIGHVFTYTNGKRCAVQERAGRLWA